MMEYCELSTVQYTVLFKIPPPAVEHDLLRNCRICEVWTDLGVVARECPRFLPAEHYLFDT